MRTRFSCAFVDPAVARADDGNEICAPGAELGGERLGACTDCRRFWAQYRSGAIDEAEKPENKGALKIIRWRPTEGAEPRAGT